MSSVETPQAEAQAAEDLREFTVELGVRDGIGLPLCRRVEVVDPSTSASEVARLIRDGKTDVADVTQAEGIIHVRNEKGQQVLIAHWSTVRDEDVTVEVARIVAHDEHGNEIDLGQEVATT
jgi:hypothetical protein